MARDGGNDITVLYLQNKINFKKYSKIPHKTHTHTQNKETNKPGESGEKGQYANNKRHLW